MKTKFYVINTVFLLVLLFDFVRFRPFIPLHLIIIGAWTYWLVRHFSDKKESGDLDKHLEIIFQMPVEKFIKLNKLNPSAFHSKVKELPVSPAFSQAVHLSNRLNGWKTVAQKTNLPSQIGEKLSVLSELHQKMVSTYVDFFKDNIGLPQLNSIVATIFAQNEALHYEIETGIEQFHEQNARAHRVDLGLLSRDSYQSVGEQVKHVSNLFASQQSRQRKTSSSSSDEMQAQTHRVRDARNNQADDSLWMVAALHGVPDYAMAETEHNRSEMAHSHSTHTKHTGSDVSDGFATRHSETGWSNDSSSGSSASSPLSSWSDSSSSSSDSSCDSSSSSIDC